MLILVQSAQHLYCIRFSSTTGSINENVLLTELIVLSMRIIYRIYRKVRHIISEKKDSFSLILSNRPIGCFIESNGNTNSSTIIHV